MTFIDQDTHFSENGFSLVEMLIAIAILSLISLTLVVASTGSTRLFQRGISLSVKTSEIVRAQTNLSELLAVALTKEQFHNAHFRGEKHTISWTAKPPSFPEISKVLQFELSLVPRFSNAESADEIYDLVLGWKTKDSKRFDGQVVLVRGLGPLEFKYSEVTDEGVIEPQYPIVTIPAGVWLSAKKTDKFSALSNTNWPDLYVKFRHH